MAKKAGKKTEVEPVAGEQAQADAQALLEKATKLDANSVYVSLTLTRVGVKRGVDSEKVVDDTVVEDSEMLNVTKDIFETKELKAVNRHLTKAHHWLMRWGYRTKFRDGVHRLPVALLPAMLEYFREQQDAVDTEAGNLADRLPEMKDNAKARLGSLYSEADYPTAEGLRKAFSIRYAIIEVGVPQQLSVYDSVLYKAEQEKARQRLIEETELVVAALRDQVVKMVTYMADLLKDSATGKAKGFRAESVVTVKAFFEMFEARNIGGDLALAPFIAQARKLLDGVSPEQLKDNTVLRRDLQKAFDGVKASLTSLVEEKPSRSIKLPD